MKFLENYFPEAHYINLHRRSDRKEHMDRELNKHGIYDYVKRYNAVVATGDTLRHSYIASGTSHRNIVQDAKDKGLEAVLILEDDIFFKDGVEQQLETSVKNLFQRDDWDLYYISANIFDNPISLVADNLMYISMCYCIHAYAVHQRAYDRVLAYDPVNDDPFDKWLNENNFRKFGGYPLICSQIDGVSDNVGGYIGYDEIFTNAYNRDVVKNY